MGDGIMALFGAPVAHEDHAVRACYAALRIIHTKPARHRVMPQTRSLCGSSDFELDRHEAT